MNVRDVAKVSTTIVGCNTTRATNNATTRLDKAVKATINNGAWRASMMKISTTARMSKVNHLIATKGNGEVVGLQEEVATPHKEDTVTVLHMLTLHAIRVGKLGIYLPNAGKTLHILHLVLPIGARTTCSVSNRAASNKMMYITCLIMLLSYV